MYRNCLKRLPYQKADETDAIAANPSLAFPHMGQYFVFLPLRRRKRNTALFFICAALPNQSDKVVLYLCTCMKFMKLPEKRFTAIE